MSAVAAALARARDGWARIAPRDAWQAVQSGAAVLIDTRTPAQRDRDGEVPDAIVIDRTVLEWRLNPTTETCIPEAKTRPQLIVICRQAFSSSFAARALRDLGLDATNVIDGVEGWYAAGLSLHRGYADIRE